MIRFTLLAALSLVACQSSTPPAPATAAEARVIELKVTNDGFEPSPITVKKGEPLRLVVTRTVDKTCGTEIVLPGYGIEKKLPLNEPVTVEFTPDKAGELKYGCAMDQMVGGVLVVQ